MAHMSWVRRDGAPSDITALAQTKDGYLWIGSRLGLYRFDGIQFSSYPFTSADPQLPSSDIYALAADNDGGLWIGYRMGGISYLHGNRKVDYDKQSGLVGEATGQLLCREDGSVWATADGRLMHLVGSQWENYSAKHGLDSDGLYTLFFDRDGNLFTAYKQHVFELKKGEDKFLPVPIPNFAVSQFAQTPDGTIWISDAWHNVRPLFDNNESQAVRIPGVPLLLADNDGSLWLAHDFGGITRVKFPKQEGRAVEDYTAANGLTDGQTRAILQDKQGAVWVGTAHGLDRFSPSPLVQFHGVLIDYHPSLIADKKSGIWIDDMDKPLMLFRDGKVSFIGRAHGSSSLFREADGAVWLHDPITHNFFRYTENSAAPTATIPVPEIAKQVENYCLSQDSQGALLACFEGHGLWRFSGTWEQIKAPGLPQEAPISLAKDTSGRVWLGYPHNQVVLDDAGGFHMFGGTDGLELNSVLTFYEADNLILAGGSDGLAYFDGRGFHSLHLRRSGLMRGVSGIVKDRFGDLWLNSGSGVIRLPAKEWQTAIRDAHHAMDFQLLNEQDGLSGSPAQSKPAPTAVVDTAGILWFATSGHIVFIDPATVRKEQRPPNVLLQAVRLNGSAILFGQNAPITVDSRKFKSLEFDYIGVDLKSPDRVVYQYMLEGQDKDWQEAGSRRQAAYTNLPPATYRFRVRAANVTGLWSELQSGVPFIVTPAFYQTSWFLVLCFVSALTGFYLLYLLRLRQATTRLNARLEERLAERTRIARDLHDTLLQSFHGLMLRFQAASNMLATRPAEAKQTLESAIDEAAQAITEGRDAIQGLRLANGEANDLAEALGTLADELAIDGYGRRSPAFRVDVAGTPRNLQPMPRDEVYRFASEALRNAFRHSQAKRVEVEIRYDDSGLRLRIRDDGKGINPEILKNGAQVGHYGLRGMNERARLIGGRLDVWSEIDSGTEIELNLPASSAYAEHSVRFRSRLFEMFSRKGSAIKA